MILVGEMRDLETIQMTLTAAETGHLVLATLHTNSAAQTVNRIIDVFPTHQQNQIRVQLSEVLLGVLAQSLVARLDDRGRVAAVEMMICNPAIRNLIRESKTFQITNVIDTGVREGMVSLDHSIKDLVRRGLIDPEYGMERANDKDAFQPTRRVRSGWGTAPLSTSGSEYGLGDLLRAMQECDASDIYVKVGTKPLFRIANEAQPSEFAAPTRDGVEAIVAPVLTDAHREALRTVGHADLAYSQTDLGRFRINVYQQRGRRRSSLARAVADPLLRQAPFAGGHRGIRIGPPRARPRDRTGGGRQIDDPRRDGRLPESQSPWPHHHDRGSD